MNIKFIAKLYGYVPEKENEHYRLEFYLISNNIEYLNKYFNNPEFVNAIGKLAFDDLYTGYYISFVGDSTLLSYITYENIYQYAKNLNSVVNLYLTTLWFVKDNSVFVNRCFVQNCDTNEIVIDTKAIFFSNAIGSYGNTTFSSNELDSASFKIELFVRLNIVQYETPPLPVYEIINAPTNNQSNLIPEKFKNRVFRSFRFLEIARSQSSLSLKIAFYIALLESLFTIGSSQISHNVSEKTALHVSNNPTDKDKNYNIIKEAYKVRSKYMHGQSQKLTNDELKVVSVDVDSILRKLYIKILADPKQFQ